MATNITLFSLLQIGGSLSFAANADWRFGLQFVGAASPNTPVDLTGITFKAQMRKNAGDNLLILGLSTEDGTLANGGSDGTLTWAVPAAQLRGISPGDYVFDLIASGDGTVLNLCGGAPIPVSVGQGVTR